MKISIAVAGAGGNPTLKRAASDDRRKGKRDERSPGTLAQCWPAERPPGQLVISPLQAGLHVTRHRAEGETGAVFACVVVVVIGLLAVWGPW